MNFFARLFGFSGERREASGAAPSAPPAAVEQAPFPIAAVAASGVSEKGGAAGLSPLSVAAALGAVKADDPNGWAKVLVPVMARHGIASHREVAHFLANCVHESNGFRSLIENMNYSAEALPKVFGTHRISVAVAQKVGRTGNHPADQRAIASIVYGGVWGRENLGNTEPDDGWQFRGKGIIQLTGRRNVTRVGKLCGKSPEEMSVWLETREGAAEAAAVWWRDTMPRSLVESDDVAGVRRKVNGGQIGLADVAKKYATILAALPAQSL